MTELITKVIDFIPAFDGRRSVAEDTRSFIKEMIIVCTVSIASLILYDYIVNLFHLLGLFDQPHPIKFGMFQGLGITFLAPFLVRALIIGRYYF